MFHLDTLRLIRRTFNRFSSILLIVLIGVAFMMGLLTSRPLMETSVDVYDDGYDLQDIQIFSSYGFDDRDVFRIREQEFAEKVFASRMVDVYADIGPSAGLVTRVEEVERNVNRFRLESGRMPEKADERLIVYNGAMSNEYTLGTKVKVYLDGEDVTDHLKTTEYTIVGTVMAPSYMAKTLGPGTMKNLDLEEIIYVPRENFCFEYYTTVYVTVRGRRDFMSFSKEYKDYIEDAKADVSVFAKRQQEKLKDRLLGQYRRKIEKGEKELAEKKEEGQRALDEAKQKLDDANIQIISGETQLSSLRSMLTQAKAEQARLEKQFNDNSKGTYDRISQIEREDPSGRSFAAIFAALAVDWNEYNSLKGIADGSAQSTIGEQIDRRRSENRSLSGQVSALESERASLQAVLADEEVSEEEKRNASARISEIDGEINELNAQISANNSVIRALESASATSADDAKARMAVIDARWGGSVEKTYNEYSTLARDRAIYDALAEEKVVADNAVSRINSEIAKSQARLNRGKRQYERGKRQYEEAVIEFNTEIEKAESDIRKAYQDLEELPEAEWMILDRDSHYASYMYASNCKQMGAIGWSMPLLFFRVAALVCLTTMKRLVDEQRGQIGIYRALGFSKGKIISKYVIYALRATIIGCALGLACGAFTFPVVIYETWRLMYKLPSRLFLFPLSAAAISVRSFAVLMGAVTAYVVADSLKEMPSRLMRPKAPRSSRKVFLEYITFIWDRLSFTSKITARNLIRYKTRFIMTVLGVAGCTSLLVLGWGIKDAIADVVDIQFGQLFAHDYVVSIESDSNLAEITGILEKDLDNEYVVPYMAYSSKVYFEEDDATVNMVVIDAREFPDVFALREAKDKKTPIRLKNSGVIVSEKYADVHKIKEGDYITLESQDGIKSQMKVAAICEMYFQHYIYCSTDYYSSVFEDPIHFNKIAVTNPVSNNISKELSGVENFESVVDFSSITRQFTTMIQALDYIILVIIVTAGSLAFVVLINLTQVNISERVREIATLKVLGFRTREVNAYIFKEIFLLTLIGAVFGMPLGVVEHRFIMNVIDMEMIRFGSTIKPLSFVYAFAVTIVFSLIVLFLMRKSLRDIEMVESLKSVE